MRITNNMLISTMLRNYERINRNLDKTFQQLSSGKKITSPSDNPVILVQSMGINTDLDQIEQHKKNIISGIDWLESTEAAIAEIGTVLNRVKELVLAGANGTMTNDDREKYAAEIEQLKSHLLQVSETTYGGDYIFSGQRVNQKPFDVTNDPADPYKFLGNEGKINREIGIGTIIDVNVVGKAVFGESDNSIFKFLDDVRDHLTNGNTDMLSGDDLAKIDEFFENVLTIRAQIGARINRLELTQNRLEELEYNYSKLLANTENIDQAEVIMYLKMQESVQRAALAVGSRIIMPTLIDFLT